MAVDIVGLYDAQAQSTPSRPQCRVLFRRIACTSFHTVNLRSCHGSSRVEATVTLLASLSTVICNCLFGKLHCGFFEVWAVVEALPYWTRAQSRRAIVDSRTLRTDDFDPRRNGDVCVPLRFARYRCGVPVLLTFQPNLPCPPRAFHSYVFGVGARGLLPLKHCLPLGLVENVDCFVPRGLEQTQDGHGTE